ncbi:TD and POZ domain-containing protein 3 [Hordeum vulgare]|nr:TD and POZ domain-containing protein 3 [Hordeum vulgare]
MLGSGFIQFELQYSKTKNLSVGDVVRSGEIFAGGHVWKIYCCPHGTKKSNAGRYVSLYLRLASKAKCVKAIFEASLLRRGDPGRAERCTKVYPPNGISSRSRGWHEFVSRSDLESGSGSVRQGCVTFLCGITVLCDSSIAVPASDIESNLGGLLDRSVGTDVSFCVKGETFHAHRAILAVQSPVFKAELFGPMAEATMACVTLHEIEPVVFKTLLRTGLDEFFCCQIVAQFRYRAMDQLVLGRLLSVLRHFVLDVHCPEAWLHLKFLDVHFGYADKSISNSMYIC